jgi:hypothetical protein
MPGLRQIKETNIPSNPDKLMVSIHYFFLESGITASTTAPVAFTPVLTTVAAVVTAISATATTAQALKPSIAPKIIKIRHRRMIGSSCKKFARLSPVQASDRP